MKVIHRGRRQGKTTDSVVVANETGAYLVVRDQKRTQELSRQTERFPITFEELLSGRMKASHIRNVVIDDADSLLRYMLPGITIESISVGGEG